MKMPSMNSKYYQGPNLRLSSSAAQNVQETQEFPTKIVVSVLQIDQVQANTYNFIHQLTFKMHNTTHCFLFTEKSYFEEN